MKLLWTVFESFKHKHKKYVFSNKKKTQVNSPRSH